MSIWIRRSLLSALALCSTALAVPAVAAADPGDVIVRFAAHTNGETRSGVRHAAGVVRERTLPVSGLEVVDPRPGTSAATAVARLERSPDVLYAERNLPRDAEQVANDPLLAQQWGLATVGAPAAWNITTGDRAVTVAVVDTGIDLTHPDLSPNLWHNPAEALDGRDDDGDGYVDDVNGWDFVDGDGDPADANGHGTHVAGTIAAEGNDAVGVSGVSWRAGLMALRALDANGRGYTSDLVRAYAYAASHGARIVNASLSGPDYSHSEYDAIAAATNVLFVVAAGNASSDDDTKPTYPCAYDLPNVLCVAASGRDDALAPFSNYGIESVDLAAPGVGILSTWLSGTYKTLSGTSMATPHVAGAAALVLAAHPGLTARQLGQTLLSSTDPIPALQGLVASGGRLDAARALRTLPPTASAQPAVAGLDPPASPTDTSATPPSTAPTPAPAPAAPATTPPALAPTATPLTFTLRAPRRITLRAALAGRLRVGAVCTGRCHVRLELTLDPRTARHLGLARAARAITIATATSTLTTAGTRSLALRPRPTTKRALGRAHRLTATVRATATDTTGHRTTSTASVIMNR